MRFRTAIGGLALGLLATLGCQSQCFMSEADFQTAKLGLPAHLETDQSLSIVPPAGTTPAPTTVSDIDRKVRYLSLREAIALALENGTIGAQNAVAPGFAGDTLVSFAGTAVGGDDSVRAFALDPAITETAIESSLSKFDAVWNNNLSWTHAENAPGSFISGTVTPAGSTMNNSVNFSTGIEKPLPTGGVAGITFTTNYLKTNGVAVFNPNYQPDLQFAFEQPLLQGFGVEINQLRDAHPGSILNPFSTTPGVEGILITRIRLDEQRLDFERKLNFLLLNVEVAYWNLYGSFYQLYSQEEGMRQAFEVWRLNVLRYQGGTIGREDLALSRLQYEQFRAARLTALNQVLENERQLRGLLGLHIEDGQRIVPTDVPTQTRFKPEWTTALNDALAKRPELLLARQDLKFRQLDLIRVKDSLLPDLRAFATYDLHSAGSQIDGGETPLNAFHNLVSDPLSNATVGLRLTMPLGFRAANASARAARLNLERSFVVLRTEETKAERFLGFYYRLIEESQALINAEQAALDAATIQLETRFRQYAEGRGQLDLLLFAQRDWASALAGLYSAIVQYNNSLAGFEFAKGSILEHDNVYISEAGLPQCAQVRAVEHERERTKALVLKEREQSVLFPSCSFAPGQINPGLPPLRSDEPAPLPALLESRPALPDAPLPSKAEIAPEKELQSTAPTR